MREIWDNMMDNSRKGNLDHAIEQIKKIGGKKIRFIALYGSTAAGKATVLSDIDLAVFYDGNKKERFEFRAKVSGRVRDVLDLQTFQDLPIYIRKEIISNGELLYFREHASVFEVFLRTIREFEDFKPRMDMYYSHMGA